MIKKTVSLFEKICSRSTALSHLYSYPYIEVVKKEIELAHIGPKDIVLNIGCGAVPYTAAFIARFTGAKVIAADKNKAAVKLANKLVGRWELSHLVEPVECNCAHSVPEGFTVAIISLQAEPKQQIFSNLLNAGNGNIRIVSRDASNLFKKHYDIFPATYPVIASVEQNMKTFNRSVLLQVSK